MSLEDDTGTAWRMIVATHGGSRTTSHDVPADVSELEVSPGPTGEWELRVERDDDVAGWCPVPVSVAASSNERRLVRATSPDQKGWLGLEIDVRDRARFSVLSAADRARRSALEWFRDSSNPVAYQLILGVAGGLMIGLFVGLLYFGTEAAQRLSGLGGTSLVGGVFYMLVRSMPELGGRDPQAARRRVYAIGIVVAVSTFLAHAFASDVIPLPLDTPTTRRVAQIEHDVALLTLPRWADERRVAAGQREWWVVPARLRQTNHIQVQLLGGTADELEVVAVGDDGLLLGGRRTTDTDEPLELQVRAGAARRFHLGVRWRGADEGTDGRTAPQPDAMVRVQSRSSSDAVQYLPSTAPALTWRGDRSEAEGELTEDSDVLGSLCGGAGDGETVLTIALDAPSWVQFRVNGSAPSVAYVLQPRGERSAVWGQALGEIACTVAEPQTREQWTATMPANMELALNAGTYHVAIDGGDSGNAAFGVQLRRAALTMPDRLAVDDGVTVDLLAQCAASGCNGSEDGTASLPVRLPAAGTYRWELLDLEPQADLWRRPFSARVPRAVDVEWAGTSGSSITRSEPGEATIRLTSSQGQGSPPLARIRVVRDVSVEEACGNARPVEGPSVRASTLSDAGTSGRFSGAVCAGWPPEVGRAAPEWIGEVRIAERGAYRIEVASRGEADLVAYLFRGQCSESALVCSDDLEAIGPEDDVRFAWDPRIDAELEPGTYYLVVDGYSSADVGEFSVFIRRTSV